MARTIGEAFIRVRTDTSRTGAEVRDQMARAGSGAGKSFGDGFYRDASGRLRQANGKFATDAQKAMLGAGGKSGAGFSSGFSRGTSKLKDILKKNVPMAAGLFVPLGLGAAVAQIGSIGMAYEDNLNIFKNVSKATGTQMGQVAAQARKLGADVTLPGVSAAGAAEAMTELAKAGFSVQQSMDAAQGTLQLARIANISEASAAEIAANAVNAFGLKAKQTSFVVDELAAAANTSSVEISDVSDAFKMAAAVFSGVQGPAVGSKNAITELNTAIAILGNNGIKGSDAGTSLKQMLLQLTGPSAQAKDQMQYLALRAAGATATLKEQNEVLHGSTKVRGEAIASITKHNKGIQVQGDIAYDSSGKMRSLRDIIALTAAGTKGLTQEDKNYAITQIFGADASRSMIALLKGGLPVYDRQTKAILATGSAASFAAAKNAGLRGSIDNLKSQFENAAISIYNQVKGPLTAGLNSAANAVAPLADGIANLSNIVRANSGVLGGVGSAVLGAAAAYGTLKVAVYAAAAAQRAWAVIQATIAFVQLAAGVRSFAAGWALLDAAMAANPIGIVVVALGALVAGIIYAYKHSETFRTIVQAAWQGIAAAAQWAWQNVIKPVVTAIVWYYTKVVGPAVLWLWHNVIEPAWHGIAWAVKAAWVVIQVIFALWRLYMVNVLFPVIRFLWNNVVKPVFTGLASTISTVWNKVIKPVLTALGGFIKDKVAPGFRTGVSAIAAAWNGIKAVATAPVRFVIDTVINKGIIAGINWVASKVGVKDRIPPIVWNSGGGGGGGGNNRITGNRGGDGPGIGDGIGSLLAGPGKWLSNRVGLGRIASRFGSNPLTHALTGAAGKAKDFALDKIQTLIGELFGAGGGSVGAGGLRSGILGVLAALRGQFGSVPLISGLRRGARTLSGNRSLHADGRAIDIPAVFAWAQWLAATWGPRLKELITPWRQFNMWNGRPHRFSRAIEAQHGVFGRNAHIHAALDDYGTRTLWPGLNVIPNNTGRPEPIGALQGMHGITVVIKDSVITSRRQAEDLVVDAYNSAVANRRIPAPAGWRR